MADARTHQRCYIVEMMGADGGFHALHSCIGGGAHYAALVDPLSDEELARVATAVDRRKGDKSKMYFMRFRQHPPWFIFRRSTVIVVAEGYARGFGGI